MIRVNHLSKTFKLSKKQIRENADQSAVKHAVKQISFEVADNEIFGLLGPNGAGKTTTLRCLSTLIKPTSGTVEVGDFDTVQQPDSVRSQLAFLTSELKLDTHFTPAYTMHFFGKLHGMTDQTIIARTTHLFEVFGVTPFAQTKINDLSTGMKQKLSIAVSLIHDPKVIIFDEPTNGLDIITAKTVSDYLLSLKSQGKTIIVSTHHMHVAEKLCDRIAILLDGQIHALGSIAEIIKHDNSANLEDAFFKLYSAQKRGA